MKVKEFARELVGRWPTAVYTILTLMFSIPALLATSLRMRLIFGGLGILCGLTMAYSLWRQHLLRTESVRSTSPSTVFVVPAVSRWYRWDWQYAVDVSRLGVLTEAALIISVMPVALWASEAVFPWVTFDIPIPLWLFWGASVAFVSAWALLFLACPRFIREYRDFGQYSKRQHSHRWIVWEFYNTLRSLSGWKVIVKETSEKGLTHPIDPTDALGKTLFDSTTRSQPDALLVLKPVNIDRDIYLPIYHDGKQLVLAMKEDDPQLQAKEKELFWILYSQAAKERPTARAIYWMLIGTSAILVAVNIIRKIFLVLRDVL